MKITNTGPRITDSDIQEIERLLQLQLPADYRSFLKSTNGGFVRYGMRINKHCDGTDILSRLLGYKHKDASCDIMRHIEDIPAYFKNRILVIGSTTSASLICYDYRAVGVPPLVYIDIADPLDDFGMKRTYPLAATFTEFLASLEVL